MKVEDFSPISDKDGKIAFFDRIRGMLKFGYSWPARMQSQRTAIAYLQRVFDNRYTALRNLVLPDVQVAIPLILIGPPGVLVLNTSPTRGLFRAQEEKWMVMGSKGFQPAQPNLLRQTALLAQAVTVFLQKRGFASLVADSALLFTSPGTNVDAQRPAVRIVQMDAIERFGLKFAQGRSILTAEDMFQIETALTKTAAVRQKIDEPGEDFFSFEEESPQQARQARAARPTADPLAPLQKTFNFSNRQWVLLGVLVFMTVLILIFFIFLIMFTL